MVPFSQELDKLLLSLTWSLWTELGVRGVVPKHPKCLIAIEELVVLTAVLMDLDPRLRDESLDWCSQYHHLISTSRLKSIIKGFDGVVNEHFSRYASTLNHHSRAGWPIIIKTLPLQVCLSHKSCLRPLESPALLNLRVRSIFGTGARADLVTFFLTHTNLDFAISDLVEVGYSKRNLAEVLEELYLGGLFEKFLVRNQQRFRLTKNNQLTKMFSPIPKHTPPWRLILEILLPLRDCIKRSEKSSESTKVVEIRNILFRFENSFHKLGIVPPPFQSDFHEYMSFFRAWLLGFVGTL
jgi:hypothetical protein